MAPCAIALQELLHICHNYIISVDVNFNALKSFCIALPHNITLPTRASNNSTFIDNVFVNQQA